MWIICSSPYSKSVQFIGVSFILNQIMMNVPPQTCVLTECASMKTAALNVYVNLDSPSTPVADTVQVNSLSHF